MGTGYAASFRFWQTCGLKLNKSPTGGCASNSTKNSLNVWNVFISNSQPNKLSVVVSRTAEKHFFTYFYLETRCFQERKGGNEEWIPCGFGLVVLFSFFLSTIIWNSYIIWYSIGMQFNLHQYYFVVFIKNELETLVFFAMRWSTRYRTDFIEIFTSPTPK
jgi:hypothetical protein